MNKYIEEMLKSGIIKFEWTGSEGHQDCVEFKSTLFNDENFFFYITKMGWENVEHCLAEKICEYINEEELILKITPCITSDAFEAPFALYDHLKNDYYTNSFGDIPTFDCAMEAYEYLMKKVYSSQE